MPGDFDKRGVAASTPRDERPVSNAPETGRRGLKSSATGAHPTNAAQTEQERTFWLVRLHNGMISHHPYKTEAARDKWAAKYRARGDRVETGGVVIRGE